MVNSTTIDLTQTPDLQQAIELSWAGGVRTFELNGVYRADKDMDSILRIGRHLSGIVLKGFGAVIDGRNLASHVIIVEDAELAIEGLTVTGGNTTNPARVGRQYSGARFRSIYEAIDGAGLLVLGSSTLKLKNCWVVNNHSGMCGGGISHQGTGLVEIDDSTFEDNTAYHTGAAIDNLTPGARFVVRRSYFNNNLSNKGSICGGPHGQVTVFKNTKATISGSEFSGQSFPIDAQIGSRVKSVHNTYDSRAVEVIRPAGGGTVTDKFKHLKRQLTFGVRLSPYALYPWVRRR